jgi:hypothetical protein
VRVIGRATLDHARIVELRVADDHEQRLREVEVDVRVHPQQEVTDRGDPRLRPREREGHLPRTWSGPVFVPSFQRFQVELGEGEVPTLGPRGVHEPTERRMRELIPDGGGRPGIDREEVTAFVVRRDHRREQGVHPRQQIVDRRLHGGVQRSESPAAKLWRNSASARAMRSRSSTSTLSSIEWKFER